MKIFKLKELDKWKDAALLEKWISYYCKVFHYNREYVSNNAVIRYTDNSDTYFNNNGQIFKEDFKRRSGEASKMKEKQKLIISGRLPGRNEAEAAARTHWSVAAKLKKDNTDLVHFECVCQHIKRVVGLAALTVTFYEKDYKRDSDNIISTLKYILDGMVNAKILANDTRQCVTLTLPPIMVDKQSPRIEVIIDGEIAKVCR